ncbi:galactose metabolism-related protein [Elasticomyces elasticus]|nr:galactose metabolism-related protein [Elasticomyces elasticus]
MFTQQLPTSRDFDACTGSSHSDFHGSTLNSCHAQSSIVAPLEGTIHHSSRANSNTKAGSIFLESEIEQINHGAGPPSRSSTLPPSSTASPIPVPSPSSRAVDVPRIIGEEPLEGADFQPCGLPDDSTFGIGASTRYDRPPRLPLPIEEELHLPGSPIISPIDTQTTNGDGDGVIPRRTSVLSSTTVDDDDLGDDIFTTEVHSLNAPTVPTLVVWKGDTDKVYVTGTFVNWERKIKLNPDKQRGGYSATIHLKPGTHHLKFMIRGDQTTSDDYPTTVDYAGNFVNYIEVEAPPKPITEADIIEAVATSTVKAGEVAAVGEPAAKPIDIRAGTRAPETASGQRPSLPGADGNQSSTHGPPDAIPQGRDSERRLKAPPREKVPRPKYNSEVPAFLKDLESNERDGRAERAKRVEQTLPSPPSLPMFLGKSILNGNMPHKDDASVLLMPNHTVLNHLATSSIKHGVLATSGTTRYKRKV